MHIRTNKCTDPTIREEGGNLLNWKLPGHLFEIRRENGAVAGIERFDFCFGEEESVGFNGLEMMVYWVDVGR